MFDPRHMKTCASLPRPPNTPPAVAGECSSLITAALNCVALDVPLSEFDHPLVIRRMYFDARVHAENEWGCMHVVHMQ